MFYITMFEYIIMFEMFYIRLNCWFEVELDYLKRKSQ